MSDIEKNKFEFIKYEATPGEKHIGLATVKLYGKIIARYKIVLNKDGSNFFPACASYKMPGTNDQYISAFILDSNSEKEELEAIIRHNVKKFMVVGQNASIKEPSHEYDSEPMPF